MTDPDASAVPAPPSAPVPSAPRRGRLAVGAGIVGIGLAGMLILWWQSGRFSEKTNDAYFRSDMVVISPRVSGYVQDVQAGANQPVSAGQIVLKISADAFEATRDAAAAEVRQRRADLVRYEADLARQQAVRVREIAQRAVAESLARFAATDAGRFERLALTGADSTQRRDQAVSLRAETAGRAIAARAEVDIATRELDALRAQIEQGRAALGAAEAKLRVTESDLEGTVIAAPTAGQIGDFSVRTGQFVEPGSRLMTLIPDDSLYVEANYKETQLHRIHPGQKARVSVDALPGVELIAIVDSVSPGTATEFALLPPENATGNFTKIVQRVPVRLRLEVDPGVRKQLMPGLSAEVDIDVTDQRVRQ